MLYLVVLETGYIEIVVPVAMEMLTRVHEKFILIVVLKCHLLAENGHCTSCRQFYPDKLKVVSVFVVLYCGSSKYNVFFSFLIIQDTGISVRKRVIKILRDICLEQPAFSKITEMCVKMIRRVNDEEGIKVWIYIYFLSISFVHPDSMHFFLSFFFFI